MTEPQPYQPQPVQVVTNGYATASLVLGIVGFFLMGIPLGIGLFLGGIPDILAIVFGGLALSRTRLAQLNGAGKGPATAGVILGAVSLVSVLFGAGTIW